MREKLAHILSPVNHFNAALMNAKWLDNCPGHRHSTYRTFFVTIHVFATSCALRQQEIAKT